MILLQIQPGALKELLMGDEEWSFLGETVLRSIIMFVVIVVSLRLLGKRGVKQLSVFELVVIIGLGSAAGDPMFYNEVGILPALVVFAMVVGLYSLVTTLVGRSKNFENLVEGKPVYLIENGFFSIANFKKEILGSDEFFAELRLRGISQLGQVDTAIEESSGEISVFYFADEDVKYGLPIMPGSLAKSVTNIDTPGHYACSFCAYTMYTEPVASLPCIQCGKHHWVKASNKKRIT